MASPGNIGRREREILTAIVETYISTGEPVGSRTLARSNRESLSAASIRNVMADLADAGFLEQPHTSAGRVPTTAGLSFLCEAAHRRSAALADGREPDSGNLAGLSSDVQEFMERTSHVLSLISHGVGVTVSRNAGQRNALEHVYFQRLADKKVLAVVVTSSGLVRDRVLRLSDDLSPADLEAAADYINQNFRGWEMESLRNEIAKRIQQERSEYDRLMRSVEQLYHKARWRPKARRRAFTWKAPPTWWSPSRTRSACGSCWRRWKRSSASSTCCRPIWTCGRRRCAWLWVWKMPCRI